MDEWKSIWRPVFQHMWISVEDALPNFGARVIISSGPNVTVATRVRCGPDSWQWQERLDPYEDYYGGLEYDTIPQDAVTHWMPLPPSATGETYDDGE